MKDSLTPKPLRKTSPRLNWGFTLVELLIVISIIAIISGVVIFNHRDFSSRIDMANLAYEVALEVREAQVFGISVVGQTANFDRGYGVHINLTEDNQVIIFFTDPTGDEGDGLYDGDVGECTGDCVRRFLISRGNEIDKICKISGGSIVGDCYINVLDIVYYRPDAEANIRFGGVGGGGDIQEGAVICLVSPQEIRSRVIVRDSGQISVDTSIDACDDDLSS